MARLTIVTITFNDSDGFVNTSGSLPSGGFEWIVIDGSSDEICKERNRKALRGRDVRLIQEPDSGIFDAMNKGLALASGELICFLNGGDQFSSLNIPSHILDSHARVGWRWAVGNAVISDGTNSWPWRRPKSGSLRLRLCINSYCHQATFVETALLREIGGFAIDSVFSDWITSLRLERCAKPFMIDEVTTIFLANGVSGRQSAEYRYSEPIRLRRKYSLEISGFASIDRLLAWLVVQIRTLKNGAPRQD